MANPEHLKILKQGVEVWNKWREENSKVEPDLSRVNLYQKRLHGINFLGANLTRANLAEANLTESNLFGADLSHAILFKTGLMKARLAGTNLSHAKLSYAYLFKTSLTGSDISHADLSWANLSGANLSYATLFNANLFGANLFHASLSRTDLSQANLSEVNLNEVRLIETDLSNAKLERARIYGISAWDIKKDGLIQKDLIITPPGEPEITVDDLEVAQFIYLMLNNRKIRDVIETITSKAVLILGRFTEERKAVLDALKDELRQRNYLPIVFDFENAGGKSVDETVNLLARMSRFVVADITDAKSIPQELRGIVPDNPSIPVVPLIWKEQREYGMFDHFRKYPWVLPLHEYESPAVLLENIIPVIIAPAEKKVIELRRT